jgi:hypothetical protein
LNNIDIEEPEFCQWLEIRNFLKKYEIFLFISSLSSTEAALFIYFLVPIRLFNNTKAVHFTMADPSHSRGRSGKGSMLLAILLNNLVEACKYL